MPASYGDMEDAFAGMVGTYGTQDIYPAAPESAGGADEWIDLFYETGIDFPTSAETIDAFENFLVAFYPQEGMSPEDWFYVREEFFELYGIDDHSVDWEAYREAIGYGRA